jgi:hypothetical protein
LPLQRRASGGREVTTLIGGHPAISFARVVANGSDRCRPEYGCRAGIGELSKRIARPEYDGRQPGRQGQWNRPQPRGCRAAPERDWSSIGTEHRPYRRRSFNSLLAV